MEIPVDIPDELIFRPMKRGTHDLNLFHRSFDKNGYPRELEELRWQYSQTPIDALFVDFAIDKGAKHEIPAAIYATFPVRFKYGSKQVVALQSLNTLTDENYRGKGLFVRTAESVFERAIAQDVSFVYGFPNDSSARGFFSKLQWQSLDPLPFLIKPLRANFFVERLGLPAAVSNLLPSIPLSRKRKATLPSRYELDDQLEFDEGFDKLWEDFSQNVEVGIQRDCTYLNWRFIAKPNEAYRMIAIREEGELRAYVIYTLKEKHGGQIGYIMEFVHHPDHAAAASALLQRAIQELAAEGCDAILAWNFEHSPNHAGFRQNHFFTLPEKVRPIKLHMGVRPLAESSPELLTRRSGWYISYCDSDTV